MFHFIYETVFVNLGYSIIQLPEMATTFYVFVKDWIRKKNAIKVPQSNETINPMQDIHMSSNSNEDSSISVDTAHAIK
jgi:hypothetical protein